jgi:hypothetical protein
MIMNTTTQLRPKNPATAEALKLREGLLGDHEGNSELESRGKQQAINSAWLELNRRREDWEKYREEIKANKRKRLKRSRLSTAALRGPCG